MKRFVASPLLLGLLLPACRSAAPKAGPAGPAAPDRLRVYVGDVRMLRAKADERRITVKAQRPLTGECDLAVRVRSASFAKDGARFSLETVGRPRVAGREPRCRRVHPEMQLLFAGLSPRAADLAARVDAVLQTPEAYLRAKGVAFAPRAAQAPRQIASPESSAPTAERLLGMKVTSWPKPLLSVSPYFHDLTGRVRQESEVEFEAVVGTDGRLHEPRLKTPLTDRHRDLVLGALSRWRYEPARTAEAPIAARVNSRVALRIY